MTQRIDTGTTFSTNTSTNKKQAIQDLPPLLLFIVN